MKILPRLIFIVILAALAFWLWTILFPSPQKIIRKRLLSMAGNISFSQNENNLVKMADAQHVADFFADNVTVDLTLPGRVEQSTLDHEEITQAMLISRQQATDLQMKFPDINVTVAPDKNSAVADVTLDATVSGEHDAILQEVKFTFEKVNGQWLIDKVETVRVLS
jgi:ketosteroid isomerase-like protein